MGTMRSFAGIGVCRPGAQRLSMDNCEHAGRVESREASNNATLYQSGQSNVAYVQFLLENMHNFTRELENLTRFCVSDPNCSLVAKA